MRRIFPYQTFSIQEHPLQEILTGLRDDSLLTTWDAEFPEFRSIQVLHEPGPWSIAQIRLLAEAHFITAESAYMAFDGYKAALESADINGKPWVTELVHCNKMQEMVLGLIERFGDLHAMTHLASLQHEPMHPELCDAVHNAWAWLQ